MDLSIWRRTVTGRRALFCDRIAPPPSLHALLVRGSAAQISRVSSVCPAHANPAVPTTSPAPGRQRLAGQLTGVLAVAQHRHAVRQLVELGHAMADIDDHQALAAQLLD